MKANSRRRVLISSMAMLLVALVALSTATFAWFTQSPTATASGVELKATASNGLKILTESHQAANDAEGTASEFVSQDFLKYDADTEKSSTNEFLLNPASYTFALNGTLTGPFKTTGADYSDATADPNAKVEGATAAYTSGDVYAEKIYCKLVGAANETDTANLKLGSLTVNVKDTALKPSLRYIVAYNDVVIGAYAESAVTKEVSLAATNDKFSAATKGEVNYTARASATNVALGEVGTDGADYVTVYVFLDGQDASCTSSNIPMSNLIDSISVVLTIAE